MDLQHKVLTRGSPPTIISRGPPGDLEDMRSNLNAQEREISKLTQIVGRLTQPTPG